MNKKLMKASIAGTAAIALAAGGTTFAGWSDFRIDPNNKVGADVLALDVNESTSLRFNDVKLAPGGVRDVAFYIASRRGDAVPKATLSLKLQNLVPTENGCDTNSEAFAESGLMDKGDTNAACNQGGPGQFHQQSLFYVQSKKATDPSQCDTADSLTDPMSNRLLNTRLDLAEGKTVPLLDSGQSLDGGEGVCVVASVFMPNSVANEGFAANDKSQGDKASFDIRFDLTQVP